MMVVVVVGATVATACSVLVEETEAQESTEAKLEPLNGLKE